MSADTRDFLGRAGQLHVMSELLVRGWNVGIPDVDVGDDVLAIGSPGSDLRRIQVKAATAEDREYGHSAQFRIETPRLKSLAEPPLTYVFLLRTPDGWTTPLAIPQEDLQKLVVNEDLGSPSGDARVCYVRYHLDDGDLDQVLCSDSELTEYADDFTHWTPVDR